MVPGDGGGEENECFMGTDSQFGKMERVMGSDSGDGCTTPVDVFQATEPST